MSTEAAVSDHADPPGGLRRLVSWTAFPALLVAALFATTTLVDRGWEPWQAFGPVVFTTFLVILALERLFPFRERWLRSHRDIRVDASYAVLDSIGLELLRPALYTAAVAVGGWLATRGDSGVWPESWPLMAELALALVIAEFPKYWVHRLEHTRDWLWRFHAPHHSVPRLYWLNASRFHPIDIGLDTIVGIGTLVLLGCSDYVIALFMVVGTVHGAFQHANLELRCGPLNWIFSMAELHRWHHSRVTREANHNYGQNLIVWDIVFGTRYLPEDREPPTDVGLDGMPHYPQGFLAQLAAPFRWSRVKAEAAPRAAEASLGGTD